MDYLVSPLDVKFFRNIYNHNHTTTPLHFDINHICVDIYDQIFVSCHYERPPSRLLKVDWSGQTQWTWMEFDHIIAMDTDNAGNLYILIGTTARTTLLRLNTKNIQFEKVFSFKIGKQIDGPFETASFELVNQFLSNSMAIHGDDIYLLRSSTHIHKINLTHKTVSTIVTKDDCTIRHLCIGDKKLYFTSSQSVWKAEENNNIIRICGGKPGYEDGPYASAKFFALSGITTDIQGNLIVCGKHLRKISFGSEHCVHHTRSEPKRQKTFLPSRPIFNLFSQERWLLKPFVSLWIRFNLCNTRRYVKKTTSQTELSVYSWRCQRLLWIGNLKEDPTTCQLAKLPKDVLKDIVQWIMTPGLPKEPLSSMCCVS